MNMDYVKANDDSIAPIWRSLARSWETVVIMGVAAGICVSVASMAARLQFAHPDQSYGVEGGPLVSRSVALIDPHDPFRFD
jgi:hypothetical protein